VGLIPNQRKRLWRDSGSPAGQHPDLEDEGMAGMFWPR
jgi:hypothetical protein